jgi:hypothetical protein
VQIVEIDDVRLQVAQAVFEVAAHGLWSAVDDALAVEAEHPALGGQEIVVATALQGLAKETLVRAEAIERRGVEVRVPEVERLQENR